MNNNRKKYHKFSIITTLLAMGIIVGFIYYATDHLHVIAIGFIIFFILLAYVLVKKYDEKLCEIQRINAELLEANKVKDQINQTEIAFLQAQIKPHFLFNTLNTISSFCISDPKRAEYLIDKLSEYLRSSYDFTNRNMYVSLDKELELVKAYVDIEKARFGSQLIVGYDIDKNIEIHLPPLTIQPLVENAIRHGVRKKDDDVQGIVTITVKEVAPNYILVSVTDNGMGITKKKLEEIFDDKTGGVGLTNIDSRIRRLYGTGLAIESEEGVYTTVSFVIKKGRELLC